MAYPAITGPYGLVPINLLGGQVYAGATRQMMIASGYATGIFNGDPVTLNAGMIQKDPGTATAAPVGIFLGCSYTDPVFGKTFRQAFPAGAVAADIFAYVMVDPDILFKMAICSAGSTIGTVTRAAIGKNSALIQNAGNLATGNSAIGLLQAYATTATLPVRIVDVVPETALTPGNYTEVICKWNAGTHLMYNATGV